MRCIYLRSIAVTTAALAVVLAVGLAAAENARQSDKAPQPSNELRGKESAAKPASGAPTPAKRKPGAGPTPTDLGTSKLPPTPTSDSPTTETAATPKRPAKRQKDGDEPLRPIPNPREGAPVSIEAASFKGVTPGVATKEDVGKAWGRPKEIARSNGSVVQLYSVDPFKRVEVSYVDGKVSSIVIRLDRSFPADMVAKQLDLATIRSVLVSNELGEILGLSYPERGVLFAFEPGDEPGKTSRKVAQIILEPISAEPFVLRAETTLDSRCDLSRRDLEQALKLEPGNARAHWLDGRALVAVEEPQKALAATAEAVRLEPDNPQYRVTHAQVLAQTGRLPEAVEEAQKAVETSRNRPHLKARATCLIGDLLASGSKPDFKNALSFHTQSVRLADPLSSDPHPAIRIAAKEVLIDAHLGAAHDIAWGEWKEKPKAVAKWLERAAAVADDLVNSDGGSQEQLFRLHVRTLAAYVGLRGAIDPEPVVKAVVDAGERLIAASPDPARKAQFRRELGMSLYDAVQICQMRSEHQKALKYGAAAAEYLSQANEAKLSPASTFLLGRLYFRLGAIHALRDHDHKAAVVWFDKAVSLLERREDVAADLGRQGEAFVSMGVSYWEMDQRDKAVELTEKGIRWMERAVKQGALDRSSLTIPYGNLAAMHRELGAGKLADRFQEMAGRVKEEKLK